MKQDLFVYLPSEIFIDILLRLTLKNISTSKCVCKPWLSLIESDAFLKSQLSKSTPALAVSIPTSDSNWFSIFKLEDEYKHEHKQDPIIKFDFPQASTIQGSANGLLLLKNPFSNHLYVCNPITREYVDLRGSLTRPWGDCYGFGVSKISGRHKVVYLNPKSGCHVYTLETGSSWRAVEVAAPSFYRCYSSIGAFVSGNLHWLVSNKGEGPYDWEMSYVCCFDLETERFSTLSTPPRKRIGFKGKLYALGEYLCFCDDEPYFYNNFIWLLKEREHGEKCWSEVQVIMKEPDYGFFVIIEDLYYGSDAYKRLQPIKVYSNGDMLMFWHEKRFIYYSKETGNVTEIGLFGKMDDDCYYINSILLTPSCLSLKRNLGMENVISF
ncbi:putative F-box protein At3g16210 [Salvia splendens]|uniref:putative F-box protein At3g16210 n=1 Tax=Salvia splendens TaxID=180675 RepID=UPI001C279BE9|nr:putative F-box protein At3g16210 [Salvia splendens]